MQFYTLTGTSEEKCWWRVLSGGTAGSFKLTISLLCSACGLDHKVT